MKKTLLIFFLVSISLVTKAQMPNSLKFNTCTYTVNGKESEPIECCEEFNFASLSKNTIYDIACGGNPINFHITRVNNSFDESSNNWGRDYSAYNTNQLVYRDGYVISDFQIIVSYYYGRYSVLLAQSTYDNDGRTIASWALKYSNTQPKIR